MCLKAGINHIKYGITRRSMILKLRAVSHNPTKPHPFKKRFTLFKPQRKPFETTSEMSHVTATVTKMHLVGGNSQVYYDFYLIGRWFSTCFWSVDHLFEKISDGLLCCVDTS